MFTTFYIDSIIKESNTITSFYIKPKQGKVVQDYKPGQFITVRTSLTDGTTLLRNYTVSSNPGNSYYRLTIKRELQGAMSRYFHDTLKVGSEIDVTLPMGDFYLNSTIETPIVLLSGGVGITPMMSMLEFVVKHQPQRQVYFLHSSLDKNVQPFRKRLKELSEEYNQLVVTTFHSHPLNDEKEGIDYNHSGFINKETLATTVKINPTYFMCGPVAFMETMYNYLIELAIPKDRILYEFFGEGKPLGDTPIFKDSQSLGIAVSFSESKKTTQWDSSMLSLLDLAEANGINPPSSCRMGTCSTCETSLLSGTIEYDPEPFMEASEGKIFICCAKPTSNIEMAL